MFKDVRREAHVDVEALLEYWNPVRGQQRLPESVRLLCQVARDLPGGEWGPAMLHKALFADFRRPAFLFFRERDAKVFNLSHRI